MLLQRMEKELSGGSQTDLGRLSTVVKYFRGRNGQFCPTAGRLPKLSNNVQSSPKTLLLKDFVFSILVRLLFYLCNQFNDEFLLLAICVSGHLRKRSYGLSFSHRSLHRQTSRANSNYRARLLSRDDIPSSNIHDDEENTQFLKIKCVQNFRGGYFDMSNYQNRVFFVKTKPSSALN